MRGLEARKGGGQIWAKLAAAVARKLPRLPLLGQIQTLDTEPQGPGGPSRFRVFPGKEAGRLHEQFFLRQQFSTPNPRTLPHQLIQIQPVRMFLILVKKTYLQKAW